MASLLETDAYKLSMAQAGFPLRRETFYLSCRKGGWHLLPFDLAARARRHLDRLRALTTDERERDRVAAEAHGYELDAAMRDALSSGLERVELFAPPAGAWVGEREPMLTITGPSFLVSWLEPLLLREHHPIQLATHLREGTWRDIMGHHVGAEHAELIRSVADAVGAPCPPLRDTTQEYAEELRRRARTLIDIVGSPERIFEVGMRSAVTEEQHRLALTVLRDEGIRMTSNVAAAAALGMKAVGTMGHEHIQRWGDDLEAFRAMRDARSAPPSYLLDTFDTLRSGVPAAIRAMKERAHPCSVRYDSGDIPTLYRLAHEQFEAAGVEPVHILEDGLDDERTEEFETLRGVTGLPPERQLYGYGGHFIARSSTNPLGRDVVAAVYKLSATSGEPRMKFGDAGGLGKRSLPGVPVVLRRISKDGGPGRDGDRDPISILAQAGEEIPTGYVPLHAPPNATATEALRRRPPGEGPGYHRSAATARLESALEAHQTEVLAALHGRNQEGSLEQ